MMSIPHEPFSAAEENRTPDREQIVREIARIAFDPETKTADRLRALAMLEDLRENENARERLMHRLDEVLDKIDSAF